MVIRASNGTLEQLQFPNENVNVIDIQYLLNDGLRLVHGDAAKCKRAASAKRSAAYRTKWRHERNGKCQSLGRVNYICYTDIYSFNVQNIVRQYVRLDEQISKLEGSCPGPRMATAEAWIEHLQAKRDAMLGLEGMEHPTVPASQTVLHDEATTPDAVVGTTLPLALRNERAGNDIVANTPTNDLAQVSEWRTINASPQISPLCL